MQTLKLNSRGTEVQELQRRLNLIPDGIYGPLTDEAVRHLQASHHLSVDGICGPQTWNIVLSHNPGTCTSCSVPLSFGTILKRTTRTVKRLIVHCSATPEGKPVTVDQIRQWHVKDRGWSDIGYHYVILLDGTIKEGRDVNLIGAHTTGYNTGSIGICYVGGLATDGKTPKDTRTEAQKASLKELLKELKKMYGNPSIHGHREFANKACPSFDAKREYSNL